jgi:cytoskeletal protein RodZ
VEHGHSGQPLQYQPTVEGAAPEQYDQLGAEDPDQEGRPWYRKPVTLIGWAILVLILLALIAYGVTQLLGSDNSKSPAPSTTSTTTTTETTTSTTTTEPTTTTSEPATTPTAAPPANPPRNQPPGNQPTQQPTHRPHLPQLPSTITVPGGPTITLPNLPR